MYPGEMEAGAPTVPPPPSLTWRMLTVPWRVQPSPGLGETAFIQLEGHGCLLNTQQRQNRALRPRLNAFGGDQGREGSAAIFLVLHAVAACHHAARNGCGLPPAAGRIAAGQAQCPGGWGGGVLHAAVRLQARQRRASGAGTDGGAAGQPKGAPSRAGAGSRLHCLAPDLCTGSPPPTQC
jgi:hypothetical protein